MEEQKTKKLHLYHISQDIMNGSDTYSDAVVAAYSKKQAAKMQPNDGTDITTLAFAYGWVTDWHQVTVKKIGTASAAITEPGVICSSFHAG